jgi:hypothetical protein
MYFGIPCRRGNYVVNKGVLVDPIKYLAMQNIKRLDKLIEPAFCVFLRLNC